MKYTYLIIDLATIFIPLLFSFHPKIQFNRKWSAFWPALLISALFFIAWDILYTQLGIWSFNSNYLSDIYVFNLPIEECLFFICIPYACVFTYYSLNQLSDISFSENITKAITNGLSIVLILTAILNYPKLYTSVTFSLLALSLLFLFYFIKVDWLKHFFPTYLILLVPFFIVNGILTGSGIDEAIVNYNDSENLGLRIGTIPIEDIFYGMLLILMNVSLFELFKRKIKS